jgi:hypothetical protein
MMVAFVAIMYELRPDGSTRETMRAMVNILIHQLQPDGGVIDEAAVGSKGNGRPTRRWWMPTASPIRR